MNKRFQSFAGRLTRSVVITVFVIMTIISVLVFLVSAAAMLAYSKAHYSDIMEKANADIGLVMSKVEVSAENIVDELAWHLATPELVASTLQYELNTNRHVFGCGIAFVPDFYPELGRWYEPYAIVDGGEITLKIIGSEAHDYFDAEWYRKGLESPEGVWSNPYLDTDGAETVLCTFSRQVKVPGGDVAGVFGADISLDELSSHIVQNVKALNDEDVLFDVSPDETDMQIYCFIIGPDGDYIVHPEKERILRTNFYDYAEGKDAAKYRKLGDAMRAGESGDMYLRIDGVKTDVYFAPLRDSGWSIGIVVPTKRVMMPGIAIGSMILFLILSGLLIVFGVCRRAIKKTTKPLIELAGSAQEVATGRFDASLPEIRTNDEVRLLRDSFDNMQKSLAEYVKELTETTARNASMESELAVARNIQMSMLPMAWPAFPERDDLDIYGSVTPAKAVGGDLFDFRIRDGKLFFCIGDVSGKGIPASLLMAVVSSLFRTLSASEDSPVRIVSSINDAMSARNENMMFVTFFVGVLDLSTGELEYTNAGHNAPVVLPDGKPRLLEVDANVPLGVMAGWEYSLQKSAVSPGTVLFLYTDGLTEATRSGGELFQEKRMLEQLSGLGKKASTQGIIARMLESVGAFVGNSEQSDDLTMLALRIKPKSGASR